MDFGLLGFLFRVVSLKDKGQNVVRPLHLHESLAGNMDPPNGRFLGRPLTRQNHSKGGPEFLSIARALPKPTCNDLAECVALSESDSFPFAGGFVFFNWLWVNTNGTILG